jgi:hypothetical protein
MIYENYKRSKWRFSFCLKGLHKTFQVSQVLHIEPRMFHICWARNLISKQHIFFLVSIRNYTPCDILLYYRCPITMTDRVRHTYLECTTWSYMNRLLIPKSLQEVLHVPANVSSSKLDLYLARHFKPTNSTFHHHFTARPPKRPTPPQLPLNSRLFSSKRSFLEKPQEIKTGYPPDLRTFRILCFHRTLLRQSQPKLQVNNSHNLYVAM